MLALLAYRVRTADGGHGWPYGHPPGGLGRPIRLKGSPYGKADQAAQDRIQDPAEESPLSYYTNLEETSKNPLAQGALF